MNLDDYIFSENVATPAGPGSDAPPPEVKAGAAAVAAAATAAVPAPAPAPAAPGEEKLGHSVSSAIPIKSRKESAQQTHHAHFVPQSVPVPAHHQRAQDEFGYVNRHHRKTSIDDRRVSPRRHLLSISCFPALSSPCMPPSFDTPRRTWRRPVAVATQPCRIW